MAKKTNTAPRFYEVVFRGKPKVVKAFLKGLMMGAEKDITAYFSYDEGIDHEALSEKFKEMFGIRAIDCHVVIDADAAAYLKKMTRRIKDETGLEITANRHIRSSSMEFSYHAYAQKYDDRITTALQDLPDGLKVEGLKHEVKRDPSAKGVEAYSVAHDYEASGSGTLKGRVDLMVEARRTLADYPLIETAEIKLNLA